MKRLLVIFGLAWAVAAPAQERSDLQTTTTAPTSNLPSTSTAPPLPPGQRGMWYPGQPLPPTEAPRGADRDKSGAKDTGPTGLFVGDDSDAGELSVAPGGPPTAIPETHLVQKGDTLWDISSRYYRNAWAWPRLWSYNPAITNPHWIYPGDLVRLLPPGGGAPPAPAPQAGASPSRMPGPPRGLNGVFLRQTGFVEPGELKQAGRIVGSKEEKLLLGTLDEAYVEYKRDKPFQVGERYTIYHPTREVKHPLSGKTLGHMVEIFGEGEVRAVTDGNIARVAIVDSLNPIERGFLIGPLKRQFKVVPPTTNKSDLQAVVVATLHPRDLIGTENIVFVDRGRDDGVEIGNRLQVTRRGDGYQPILAKGPVDDRRFPRENIAEILVIDLRDHLATGMVTHSTKEARIGDRVESRRGY